MNENRNAFRLARLLDRTPFLFKVLAAFALFAIGDKFPPIALVTAIPGVMLFFLAGVSFSGLTMVQFLRRLNF